MKTGGKHAYFVLFMLTLKVKLDGRGEVNIINVKLESEFNKLGCKIQPKL